jgi:hypothetical protein
VSYATRLQHRINDLEAALAQAQADAEVGRLLREVTAAFGHQWGLWPENTPDGVQWCACHDTRGVYYRRPTPAAALRALLEGGQHDAG